MRTVELEGVGFKYLRSEDRALRKIDLSCAEGERTAIIGRTGAGKSTLLRCCNRLVPASYKGEFQGTVRLLGEDVSDKKPFELAAKAGMVLQDFESQLFSTTCEQDVAFGPENLGLPRDEIRQRITNSLRAVGLEDLRRRDSSTLSGGQKQRLAIASVLSLNPSVLLLDEPVTDLDAEGRADIESLTEDLCQQGFTVIMAEHETGLLQHADRLIGLDGGDKVLDAPCREVLWKPAELERLGVRPPDLVVIMDGLGLSERPRDINEAGRLLHEKGFTLETLQEAEGAGNQGPPLISMEDVHHTYQNGVEALSGISLDIKEGEFVSVLGRNGSGKTTLVKHINGLLKPIRGEVKVDDKDTREARVSELGRMVGFVFQDPDHQIFAGRVFDEVAFAPRNFGFGESEVRERVGRSLELVGLSHKEDADPFLLTKGERQRVALASIIAADPPVIVMDEPTTGLDYPAQRAVMDLLKELNHKGTTVIMITHALWVAAEYADRCVLLHEGRVLKEGPARLVLTEQELLNKAGLAMPEAAALGLAMGGRVLTAEEFLAATKKE
ncbi:MAG: energy-coupling factor transporter ATPase [bacterium]